MLWLVAAHGHVRVDVEAWVGAGGALRDHLSVPACGCRQVCVPSFVLDLGYFALCCRLLRSGAPWRGVRRRIAAFCVLLKMIARVEQSRAQPRVLMRSQMSFRVTGRRWPPTRKARGGEELIHHCSTTSREARFTRKARSSFCSRQPLTTVRRPPAQGLSFGLGCHRLHHLSRQGHHPHPPRPHGLIPAGGS